MSDQFYRPSSDVQVMMAYDAGKKSTGTAFLLWFFLGGFGGHRFYLGQTGAAIGMIALNLLGWLTLIFIFGFFLLGALGVWLLVDAFLISGWVQKHNSDLAIRLGMAASAPAAAPAPPMAPVAAAPGAA